MDLRCKLGRHRPVQRGVRNGMFEFGRCDRCACDMMRTEGDWKRVPRGHRVVWRPNVLALSGGPDAGQAAFAREVDLRGVTVVGERRYGSQRFALVVLNQTDDQDYSGGCDKIGLPGPLSEEILKKSSKGGFFSRFKGQRPAQVPLNDSGQSITTQLFSRSS